MSAENAWYTPVPDPVKATGILSYWRETLGDDFLPIYYCVFCQLKYPRSSLALEDWRRLIPGELAATFHPRTQCGICFPVEESEVLCCTNCSKSLQQCKIPRECQVNQLSIPCNHLYPAELSCLTPVEERLIAIGVSYCLITKFHIDPESQKPTNVNYRKLVKSHVTVFANDVVGVSRVLPPSIDDIAEQVRVIWVGPNTPKPKDISGLMSVSRRRVSQALLWLKQNNPLYRDIEINEEEMRQWGNDEDWVPPQFLADICHVRDSEAEQGERAGYVPRCDIAVDDEQETEHDAIPDIIEMEEAQFVGGGDVDEVPVTSSGFTNLPRLGGPDNADCLVQIHDRIRQSLKEAQEAERNALSNKTTFQIQFHQEQGLYLSVCRGSQFLNWYKDDDFFPACFPALFPFGNGGPRAREDELQRNFSLKKWAEMLLRRHGGRFATHPIFPFLIFNTDARSTNAQVAAARVSSSRYARVCEAVARLDETTLKEAEEELKRHRKCTNPDVNCLLKEVSIVGHRHPLSNESKMNARQKIKAFILRYGMPAIWFTLNPNDLTNPICLKLAVYRKHDMPMAREILDQLTSHLRRITRGRFINRDPVSAAIFFKTQIEAFFKHLVRPNQLGCFGKVSQYFAVVESNGRGMLHLHGFLWYFANLRLPNLLDDLRDEDNEEYREQVLAFMDDTFSEDISDPSRVKQVTREKSRRLHTPNPSMLESIEQCARELQEDSDFVAAKTQKHICGAVCVKYGDAKKRKQATGTACRFGCPWRCHDTTHIDEETGNINLRRRDPRLNRYNKCIATALRFNHDFTSIATKTRALSIVHYIGNYATKFETPVYQRVALISMVADDEAKKRTGQVAISGTATSGTAKTFMHRVFNKICTERELSAVEVCAHLLGHNFDYSSVSNDAWVWVHPGTLYWCIVRHWRLLRRAIDNDYEEDEEGSDEINQLNLTIVGARPTCFSTYLSRGPDLKSLCFYDYVSLIKIEKKSGSHTSYSACFDFIDTPSLESYTQQVRSVQDIGVPVFSTALAKPDKATTPKFWHEIINLALFVPWEQFFGISSGTIPNVWQQCQETLPRRLRMHSGNLNLLRKSAEDAKLDAKLWHSRTDWGDIMDELINEGDDDTELEEPTSSIGFHDQIQLFRGTLARTLEQAHDIIPNPSLYKFVYDDQPISGDDAGYSTDTSLDILRQLDSYLQDMPDDTRPEGGIQDLINGWKRTLERQDKTIKNTILGIGQNSVPEGGITQEPSSEEQPDLDGFAAHENGGVVYSTPPPTQPPMTTVTKELVDIRSYYNIARDIADEHTLNEKQRLFLFGCASHLDSIQNGLLPGYPDFGNDISRPTTGPTEEQNQLFLYLGGEGGTGKSACINSLVKLFERKMKRNAIVVTAMSGTAAFNIGGITIHSALKLITREDNGRVQSFQAKPEEILCWQAKEVILIDECSMMSAQMLVQIDKALRRFRRCDDFPFGGIPVVLLSGDFLQFPPIGGSSLLHDPVEKRKTQQENGDLTRSLRQGERDHHTGHEIFQLFDNVIILTKQMRQSADPEFGNMLRQLREQQQTAESLQRLNDRVISFNNIDTYDDTQFITRTNAVRYTINLNIAFQYAISNGRPLHIFLSKTVGYERAARRGVDNCTRSARPLTERELLDAFEIMDNTNNHVPAYFQFVPGMPIMVTKNTLQGLGIANGSVFTAVDFLPNPSSERIELSSGIVVHNSPPDCLLIASESTKSIQLPGLDAGVIPLFPISEPIIRQGQGRTSSSIWRTGLPCTPAFAITDYKSQSQTFNRVCLDIDTGTTFSSLYVGLSRCQTREGVSLLRPIPQTVWNKRPNNNIKTGMMRLEKLSEKTIEKWKSLLSQS